jgi:hypothetical protein
MNKINIGWYKEHLLDRRWKNEDNIMPRVIINWEMEVR